MREELESGSYPGRKDHSIRNMGDVAFVIIRKRRSVQTVFVNEEVNFSIHDLEGRHDRKK